MISPPLPWDDEEMNRSATEIGSSVSSSSFGGPDSCRLSDSQHSIAADQPARLFTRELVTPDIGESWIWGRERIILSLHSNSSRIYSLVIMVIGVIMTTHNQVGCGWSGGKAWLPPLMESFGLSATRFPLFVTHVDVRHY
jgi:hypothetical protein